MKRVATVPPLTEWGWILLAGGAAVVAELGLRTLGLPRTSKLVGAPLRSSAGPETATAGGRAWEARVLTTSQRTRVRATRRVMRHWPFGDTCLRQALVSGALLRGHSPELVVGVAKIEGEIRAHAWLEIGGIILDPLHAASAYMPLAPVDQR